MKKAALLAVLLLPAFAVSTLFFVKLARSGLADSDTTAPTSTIALVPSSPDGSNGWYVSPIDITINADDLESGVREINWQLDSEPVETKVFTDTLNQAPNPSFETAGSPIDQWSKTNDDGLAEFSQDAIAASGFGAASAKITTTAPGAGWHGFDHGGTYAVATPFQNMTSSAWIKVENVTSAARFDVYVVYDNGDNTTSSQLVGSSSQVSGTADWQKITYNFVANHAAAVGVYMDVGLQGEGTAWFDGVSISGSLTQSSANFAVSTNGAHTLTYWAVDNAGNEELPHNSVTFKIDTRAPSRWTNFTLTEAGNNHTFIVSIRVSDLTSGLDVSTAEVQYSVDQGVTWGYYPTLTSCSGTFQSGWFTVPTSPSTDGSTQVTLTTPAIDFCNSNWASTKEIRFRITDMAGNQSQSPDFTINGAWVQITKGNVYSNFSIGFQGGTQGGEMVGAVEDVSGITSAQDWYVEDYEAFPFETYAQWYATYPTTTSLPSGRLPTVSGRYRVNSDFTISGSTIPSGFSTTQNMSAVIFVNGDLNINTNFSNHATSGIIFIVRGDVTVASGVSSIHGFFITDGQFDAGTSSTALTVNGGVQADSFNLKRSLNGGQNSSNPAETFTYDSKYLIVGRNQLTSNFVVKWLEVK